MGRSAASGSLEGDARRSLEDREDVFDVDHSPGFQGRPGITLKRFRGRRAPHGAARGAPQKKPLISQYRSF